MVATDGHFGCFASRSPFVSLRAPQLHDAADDDDERMMSRHRGNAEHRAGA